MFAHGTRILLDGLPLFGCFHVSRRNTFTGGGRIAGARRDRLTPMPIPTPVSFPADAGVLAADVGVRSAAPGRRRRSGQTIRAAASGRDDTGWAFSLATLTLHR